MARLASQVLAVHCTAKPAHPNIGLLLPASMQGTGQVEADARGCGRTLFGDNKRRSQIHRRVGRLFVDSEVWSCMVGVGVGRAGRARMRACVCVCVCSHTRQELSLPLPL